MMDDSFYQFWRDVSAKATSGQIRLEEVADWMRLGNGVPEPLMDMFRKYYGIASDAAEKAQAANMYEAAMTNFKKSLTELYVLMDVVPRSDYLELEKKYNALKREKEDLEALAQQLKLLFKTCSPNVEEGVRPLNQMLKSQNEQFLQMMESLAGFYGISPDKKDGTG